MKNLSGFNFFEACVGTCSPFLHDSTIDSESVDSCDRAILDRGRATLWTMNYWRLSLKLNPPSTAAPYRADSSANQRKKSFPINAVGRQYGVLPFRRIPHRRILKNYIV